MDDLPGGGTLAVETGLAARVLGARPDLIGALASALDEESASDIRGLAAQNPAGWMAVITTVAGAYYLDPRVRRRIGYDGQVAKPVRPDNYPAYIAEGLLDHLLDGNWLASRQHMAAGPGEKGELG